MKSDHIARRNFFIIAIVICIIVFGPLIIENVTGNAIGRDRIGVYSDQSLDHDSVYELNKLECKSDIDCRDDEECKFDYCQERDISMVKSR